MSQREHLTKDPPHGVRSDEEVTERQWWCRACGNRVTVGADGGTEYGHERACSHHFKRRQEVPA